MTRIRYSPKVIVGPLRDSHTHHPEDPCDCEPREGDRIAAIRAEIDADPKRRAHVDAIKRDRLAALRAAANPEREDGQDG